MLAAVPRIAGDEYEGAAGAQRQLERRARTMARAGALADPVFAALGVRPEAFPLSMAWVPRGARELRRRLASAHYDAVVATGPPVAALLAARASRRLGDPPLVVELRDLWAGNPLFDRRGGLLGALERRVFAASAAIVTVTPEAAADVRRRHPSLADRVVDIPNGFEDELLDRRRARSPSDRITILHSGTLTADRPLAPLLRALAREPYRDAFRLVVHGYVAPPVAAQIAAANGRVAVELVGPSAWEDAVARIAAADVALVSQAASAGDATAVAGKVYEYLALGRPGAVPERRAARPRRCCDGVGADALLRASGRRRLDLARLDRLLATPAPAPVAPELLVEYRRTTIARRMAELLDAVASRSL